MRRTTTLTLTAVVAAAGLAAPALAQDSISNTPAPVPGDALSPYAAALTATNYVVRMAPLTTSGGTMFGIAPIVKSPNGNVSFANNLISAQSISQDTVGGRDVSDLVFDLWTPMSPLGSGVNPQNNASSMMTANGPGNSFQIAGAFTDFGTSDFGVSQNNVITGIVNYTPDSDDLYVRRRVAGVNAASVMDGDFAQLGYGSVDAAGNTFFRADDFGPTGGSLPAIQGQNIFRVSTANLMGAVNTISDLGGSVAGATGWIVQQSGDTVSTPSAVPASVAGDTDGQYMGATFNTTIAYGDVGSVVETPAFLDSAADGSRGPTTWSPAVQFPGTSGTGAIYAQLNGTGTTQSFSVFGVNADGSVSGARTLTPPSPIFDPTSSQNITVGFFSNYRSQIPFRGGNGLIAVGQDLDGRDLAAATTQNSNGGDDFFADDPQNSIVVARYDADGTPIEWSVAAWVTGDGNGSPIFDAAGAQIGNLTPLFRLTDNDPLGPTITPPAFDRAGNIYFISTAEFTDSADTLDTALFRAVYNPTDFSYRLEVVLRTGDVFPGLNSGRNYQISFLTTADGNSLSSGAFFSGNVNQMGWGGSDASAGENDPGHMGGLVFNAAITYDADNDGDFDINTTDDPGTADQRYQVLMMIGNMASDTGPEFCATDWNENGSVDIFDILAFLTSWNAMDPDANFNNTGGIDIFDILAFLEQWNTDSANQDCFFDL